MNSLKLPNRECERRILYWSESRIGDGVKVNKPTEDPLLGLCRNWVWTTRKCALLIGISNCTLPFDLAVRQPQECKFMLFRVWGKVRELSLPAAILITALVPGRDSFGTDATFLPSRENGLGCVYQGRPRGIDKDNFCLIPQQVSKSVVLQMWH